ncbi:MAG: HDOD domain-containing protein [Leptospiraceae bacterium]|nr:HDOD domain-containing protein [Leptospiraceae bacterium]MDW8306113.1 HDOD domain-containing protein [Leptospiraceae bacterium]
MMGSAKLQNIDLPPMPQVVSKILQIEESNIDVSSDQLQAIVAVDPALTSKILKIANSAFYARSNKVTSLSQAITLLGFKTIKSLTLLVSSASLFPRHRRSNKVQKELWMRSVLSALIAKIICEQLGRRNLRDEAFMAALLKDMGMMILNNQFTETYGMIFYQADHGLDVKKLRELEKKELGVSGPEVSELAMQRWNFPAELYELAKLEHWEIDVSYDEKNPLVLPVIMAGILVILGGYTEYTQNLKPEWHNYYHNIFENYASHLKLEARQKSFFLNDLKARIAEDSFYSFCEELFSM